MTDQAAFTAGTSRLREASRMARSNASAVPARGVIRVEAPSLEMPVRVCVWGGGAFPAHSRETWRP